MKKTLLASGLLLIFIGITFALLPHETHNSILGNFVGGHEHHTGMEHGTHNTHLTAAYIITAIGLLTIIIGITKK